ncbi:hypothetical protein BD770DRAFT_384030 [Pilaira anomala]|nr:hypothetical protein BD770DRAFT_384030 [Pilaira anomala]
MYFPKNNFTACLFQLTKSGTNKLKNFLHIARIFCYFFNEISVTLNLDTAVRVLRSKILNLASKESFFFLGSRK